MCYKCYVCYAVSKPKQPKRVHVQERAVPSNKRDDRGRPVLRQEIAQEVPVCEVCNMALTAGLTLKWLIRDRRPKAQPKTVVVNVPEELQPEPALPVFRPVFLGMPISV